MTKNWFSCGLLILIGTQSDLFCEFLIYTFVKITHNKYLWWGPKICFQTGDSEFPMKFLIHEPLIIFWSHFFFSFYAISYRKNKSTTSQNGIFLRTYSLIFCIGFYVENLLTMVPPSNDCSPPNPVQGVPSLPHQACKLSAAPLQCVLSKKNGVILPKTQWEKHDCYFKFVACAIGWMCSCCCHSH